MEPGVHQSQGAAGWGSSAMGSALGFTEGQDVQATPTSTGCLPSCWSKCRSCEWSGTGAQVELWEGGRCSGTSSPRTKALAPGWVEEGKPPSGSL